MFFMEITTVLSIGALAISGISLYFSFMRFGLNITQEFVERTDVRQLRDTVETSLRNQLSHSWRELIENNRDRSEFDEEIVSGFFEFGLDAFICKLPTYLMDEISDRAEKMLKYFAKMIISLASIGISYYVISNRELVLPLDNINLILIVMGMFFFGYLIGAIQSMWKEIPEIIEIRKAFFKLSPRTTLEEARRVGDDFQEKEII
ncbi:MAG: hypothetical protein ACTSXD_01060 [Candidatus Heimdallarchaeaceae archaeon]